MQPIIEYATPVLNSAYAHAAPYVTPYIPSTLSHVVVTSSLGGTFGGQVVTLLAGEKLGFTTSLALAYAGAQVMDSESTKAMLITAGLQLLPSIVKRVASDVLSTAIIGTGKVGIQAGVSILKLPFTVIGGAWSASSEKEQKIAHQSTKIQTLKAQKLKLTEENATLAKKNNELKALLEKLKQQNPLEVPAKEVTADKESEQE